MTMTTATQWRLAELAERAGGTLRGNPDRMIQGVSTLQNGMPGTISFLANPRYRKYLQTTQASVVILKPEEAEHCPVDAILAANPYAGFARITQFMDARLGAVAEISPNASIHPTAQLGNDVCIASGVVIQEGAKVGDRVHIGPNCVLGADVVVGDDTRLVANISVCRGVILGPRCLLHPGAVIGADGFGFAQDDGRWEKICQLGSVRLGADVEIGANTTVDRGAVDNTVIGDGVKLDNLIQIGHNSIIGAHTAIAAGVVVAGSAIIGERCTVSVLSVVLGHLEVTDDVHITPYSMVTKSIKEPGTYSSGIPVEPNREWRRNQARFHDLDKMARRLAKLEAKLKEND